MADYSDDDNYDHDERERLQKSLFAMQDMLKQLNEAKAVKDNTSPTFRGRGRRGRGRPGAGWRGEHHGFNRHSHSGQNYRSPSRGRDQFHHQNQRRYDDGQNNLQTPRQNKEACGIRPQFLVEILANFSDFSCSLLQLLEDRNIQPSAVRTVAGNYPDIFCLRNETVELKPQIRICADHGGPRGCLDAESCNDLHICNKYVMQLCRERNCILGHRWRTGHNDPVLSKFFIERLPFPTLISLLRGTKSSRAKSTEPLGLCWSYNQEGCTDRECPSLHLCASFVKGMMKCRNTECQLNHDILTPSCHRLLETYGIATNETPRDILVALLNSSPSLEERIHEFLGNQKSDYPKPPKVKGSPKKSTPDTSKRSGERRRKNKKSAEEEEESSSQASSSEKSSSESDSDSESSQDIKKTKKYSLKRGQKGKKSEQKTTEKVNSTQQAESSTKTPESSTQPPQPPKPETRRTLWSHYLQGDVPIPEICYYSVESSCRNESSGCQRLHATKHFHWQVSDENGIWLNLRPDQVESLEYGYCEPATDAVALSRLDPASLEYNVSRLFIIMGRETWHSDFKTMSLTNASKSKSLKIRRLVTENIVGQEIKPRLYVWYFLDKNDEWVPYGNVDTAGASHLVSSITSNDIEKAFLQSPDATVPFKNSKFTYVLDLKIMSQMNVNTRVTRKVIRRPRPHLQEAEAEEEAKKATSDLPDSWEKMQPEERMRLVSLPPSSSEYKTVLGLLTGNISSVNVMKVQRVQNPFLWRAFQNKIKEMTVLYKDASQVNVRQLFHGTSPKIVPNICRENFDWRLHGSKSGQSFGRGTYFAVDPNYSYNYADPDANNMRYMFIAQVAVGAIVQGNSSMVRPSVNPKTSQPFDSTVDRVPNPGIIVKYDKQEYYPEYLLTVA